MKLFKIFVSSIASFLLTIVIVLVAIIFSVSSFSSKENMIKNTKKINLSLVFSKIRYSGSVSNESNITIALNDLYDMALEFGVSKKDVDKIINSSITKEIIGLSLGNLTDYVFNNKNNKIITSDDIYNIVDENMDDLLEDVSITISPGQKEKFLNRLKLELPDALAAIPTVKDITKDKKSSIDKIHFVFGNGFKIFLIIFGLFLLLLIVILEKKMCYRYLLFSILFSGMLLMISSLFVQGTIMSIIYNPDISIFVNSYAKLLSNKLLFWGLNICIFCLIVVLIKKQLEKKVLL